MDPDEPTHFDLIVVGTGLTESILSAALTKAGYAVLVLSPSKSYGDDVASLTLRELSDLASRDESCTWSAADDSLLSKRFEVSLCPAFVKSRGEAIECAIRSRVASYLDFGLVGGIASCSTSSGPPTWSRVPATKGDVFTNDKLSLVEKRRVTKLLLRLASSSSADERLAPANQSLEAHLTDAGLSEQSREMLYAASLCTCPSDDANESLARLRSYIQSTGVYGPSPFLVGHYGGIGDLVAGYSRICAVWGGGQILGHKLGRLDRSPTVGKRVAAAPLPFASSASADATDKAEPPALAPSSAQALGVPVELDEMKEPTVLTADYVVVSSQHLPLLVPEADPNEQGDVIALQAIYVLDKAPSFPCPADTGAEEEDDPKMETKIFVLPADVASGTGSVSMVLTGSKTNSAPEGYWLLHALVPFVQPEAAVKGDAVLAEALASLDLKPVAAFTRRIKRAHKQAATPANMVVVEPVASTGRTESLSETIEECTIQARDLFVKLAGPDVAFFAPSARQDEDDES